MSKYLHVDALDDINVLVDDADKMVLCSQAPATFAEANTTYKLAEVSLGADIALGSDGSAGRQANVASKDFTGTANGTANHLAILDTVNSKLLAVTELDPDVLVTSAATHTIQAFAITRPQPV